jgi:hypothetical protein
MLKTLYRLVTATKGRFGIEGIETDEDRVRLTLA